MVTSALVFVLVVLQDPDREGRIYTHVRRLSEEYVTFTHEDPELFFPDDA